MIKNKFIETKSLFDPSLIEAISGALFPYQFSFMTTFANEISYNNNVRI